MRRILGWLDENLLAVAAGFLLIFIPLYPKWPLFDILYGYNVRVRLEDLFVAATFGLFLFQLLRRKVLVIRETPITKGLLIYLLMGFLSMLTAFFVIKTVPLLPMHMEKTFLHWLRRLEYFSLFFVFFASIRSWKRVKVYLWIFFMTLLAVIIYGYGQKYLYWPAFSTMNREFAKGWWLYLTAHARLLSTFGGHYDLAAYLVIALSLTWSFFFGTTKRLAKIVFGLLIAGGFWSLVLTASRSSFVGYLIGLSVVVFVWTFKKGLGWGISRWVVAVFLSVLIMLSFGDLSDRFLHVLRIADRISVLQSILLRPTGAPPQNNAVFLENNLAAVTSSSDQPPTPLKPEDVGTQVPLYVPEKTASGATVLVQTPRTYSQNALEFDLSTGIRLDATWPDAIKGFLRDPILGSGYATLNKTSLYDFTDAESTDNDYLRSLGETGLLGFVTFFGTVVLMAVITFRALGGIKDPVLYSLCAGFIGLVVGLLANATLVDLFEASKVAYVFWGVAGLTMGSLYLTRDKIRGNMAPLKIDFPIRQWLGEIKRFFLSDKPWVLLILALTFALRLYRFDGPVADWHSWRQADTSAVTRDFVKNQEINWLYPTYEDLSKASNGLDNPAGLRLVEFPIYNAVSATVKAVVPELSVEEAGRVTTIFAMMMAALFLFLICRQIFSRRVAYLAALAFSVIPYSIYYGRTILPDPSMVATSLGAIWFSVVYAQNSKKRYFILSLIFAAAALLIKPFAAFLLTPVAYIWLVAFWNDKRRLLTMLLIFSLAAMPLFLWRFWIAHYPAGVPYSDWLYNINHIRFKGAFWYWLFADRIGRLILGYWGLIPLGFGVVRKLAGKYRFFALWLWLSSFAYLSIFATGNVQHDYYQILLLPSLAIFVGLGLDWMLSYNLTAKLLAIICSLFMVGFGWYFVRDYFNINRPEIVAAGHALADLAGEHGKALVIAPYDEDSAFLYQTTLKGWPYVEKPIPEMIKMGADYYVSVNFDSLTNQLLSQSETKEFRLAHPKLPPKPYLLLANTDKYVIIQLVPDKDLPGN
ncbi:MAG: glycosyltransferase family 39 protein [Patescibacteria group bacterium]|nr:glycosyltransferase family 39 protein [Patescibacteria group bacterium]MCL5431703.1 glycosyltransferase family 39 protein [Patescibacteria group bacterium]